MKMPREMERETLEEKSICEVCKRIINQGAEIIQSAIGTYSSRHRTPYWNWRLSSSVHFACYKGPFIRQTFPHKCNRCQKTLESGEDIYYRKQGLMTGPNAVHAEQRLPDMVFVAHHKCMFGKDAEKFNLH